MEIYDTTLRDGTQGVGVSVTLTDKLNITRLLDNLGVDFIEGGYPLSNPKDVAYFEEVQKLDLKHAKVTAFGMTRRKDIKAADDVGMQALVGSGAPVITVVGKTWDLHVDEVLRVSREENLAMIRDSVAFCAKADGVEQVFYDAEHFFDGYRANPAVRPADPEGRGGRRRHPAGAVRHQRRVDDRVDRAGLRRDHQRPPALRHQAGGPRQSGRRHPLPQRRGPGRRQLAGRRRTRRHSGAGHHQRHRRALRQRGPAHGHRQPQTQARLRLPGPRRSVEQLAAVAAAVYETTQVDAQPGQPYVGANAFAHKGGMHVHAVQRIPHSYEHVEPTTVGNQRRILVSELSGRSNIVATLGDKFGDRVTPEVTTQLLQRVQDLEHRGYQFESAPASLELLMYDALGEKPSFWMRDHYRCVILGVPEEPTHTEAIVKLRVGDVQEHRVADGDGPVNALDAALRKCLEPHYPVIDRLHLVDYAVRVVNPTAESAAKVRATATFEVRQANGTAKQFATVGVDENIVDASWQALSDAIQYHLIECGS